MIARLLPDRRPLEELARGIATGPRAQTSINAAVQSSSALPSPRPRAVRERAPARRREAGRLQPSSALPVRLLSTLQRLSSVAQRSTRRVLPSGRGRPPSHPGRPGTLD